MGDNRMKRRITYVGWCFMCKASGEDANCLLDCVTTSQLWWEMWCSFGTFG